MKFAESEFKDMEFNPFEVPKGKTMLDKYSELAKYKEFSEPFLQLDKDKVIRYIVYCFSKRSPVVKKENDINKRKLLALELAGFKPIGDSYSETILKMISGGDKNVNRMIYRFLKSTQRDIKYATVRAAAENYYYNLYLLISNEVTDDIFGEAEKKAKIAKLLPDLLNNIEELSKDIFVGDTMLLYTALEVEEEEQEMEIPHAERHARGSVKIN